jgi:glyoxalase/bleomycin resistance protein/dioxygenase superfamily protein
MGKATASALRSVLLGLVLLIPWLAGSTYGADTQPSGEVGARISGQVTFLYYGDLAVPRKFYGQTLGLVPYLESDWVILFHVTSGATIGLVKAPKNRPSAAAKRSVVMVSLVTDDVAAWYRKLRNDASVRIVKPLYDHPSVPIRAFEIEDPAGYPIEFFQWLDPRRTRPRMQ